MSYCSKCGAQIPEGAKFCPKCGKEVFTTPQAQYQPQGSPNPNTLRTAKEKEDRWVIALVFSIVLGYFGVHRFYTGNIATGVLMLLTGGGCGIWYIIDIVMIACNSYTDSDGQTLK